jgi:hypothetical protein
MTALAAEARSAGEGLVGLVRGRAGWDARFRFTTDGFLRSFAAPLAALPLAVVDAALFARAGAGLATGAATGRLLLSAGAAHLLDAFGFPVLLALIAAPLRFEAGYAAFVTVNNWATLYLNLALTAAATLLLLGAGGASAFSVAALALLCLSVALVWRIGYATLTRELGPLVLLVLLSVVWSTLAEQLSRAVFGA